MYKNQLTKACDNMVAFCEHVVVDPDEGAVQHRHTRLSV